MTRLDSTLIHPSSVPSLVNPNAAAEETGNVLPPGLKRLPPRTPSRPQARPRLALDLTRIHTRDQRARSARLRFVVETMVASLLVTGLAAGWRLGSTAAFLFTFTVALSLCVYGWWMQDRLFQRLLVFGLTLGLGELVSDYFCVVIHRTLVYPVNQPQIWVSPAYMPVAWMVAMVQLGTVAEALLQRTRRLWLATWLMAVLGGSYIPIFETLASHARAWSYHNIPLVFDTTPTYVLLTEALLSASLPWMMSQMKKSPHWGWPSLLGLAQAAWILASLVITFWWTG